MISPSVPKDDYAQIVFSKPVRTIGGLVGKGVRVTLFMHEGYDRPLRDIGVLSRRVLQMCSPYDGGRHVFEFGDFSNPCRAWPLYAVVEPSVNTFDAATVWECPARHKAA